MNEPQYYEHKKWICNHRIVGIVVDTEIDAQYQTLTYWNLLPAANDGWNFKPGQPYRIPAFVGNTILKVDPDWNSIAEPVSGVREEVEEYKKFLKKNARELSEYKRLKAKFG